MFRVLRLLFGLLIIVPSTAVAKPTITWNLSTISQRQLIGTTASQQVNFISDAQFTNVNLEVVPELAPYVSVSPTNFITIQAGVPQTVLITYSTPKGAPVVSLRGTIHFKDESTIAKPLPVTVQTRNQCYRGNKQYESDCTQTFECMPEL